MPDRVLSLQSNAWIEIKRIQGETSPKLPEYNALAKEHKPKIMLQGSVKKNSFYIGKNDALQF